METLYNIFNHIVVFFMTMTVLKWILGMVLAYVIDIICLYFQSLRSLFIKMDLEDFLKEGPSKYQIAIYFVWPFYIPSKILVVIWFFFYGEQYDTEEEEKLNKEIKEFEEKRKNRS